jgi:hypothetical protein
MYFVTKLGAFQLFHGIRNTLILEKKVTIQIEKKSNPTISNSVYNGSHTSDMYKNN